MTILFFVHGLVLLAIGFMLWKSSPVYLRRFFWPSLLLKVGAGIGIGLLYTLYYTGGDTFNYFHDGVALSDFARRDFRAYTFFLWHSNPDASVWGELLFQEPRALFFSKIVSIFSLITSGNYWILACYFSVCSFAASWYLVRMLYRYDTRIGMAAVVAFLFFPSVVFWSAGILKESLAMASLYFLCVVFFKRWQRISLCITDWLLLPVCIGLLWMLKYYYLAVFLPVAFTALAVQQLSVWFKVLSGGREVVVWVIVFIGLLWGTSSLHPNFYPERFGAVIVSNYEDFSALSDPEDRIDYAELDASAASILRNAPKALLSGIFRPFPWEAHTMLQGVAAIENCLLFVLLAMSALRWRQAWHSKERLLIFSLVVYVAVLAVFLALSTPNFGTLSRYRIGFVPFFVFLVGCGNVILERLHRTTT